MSDDETEGNVQKLPVKFKHPTPSDKSLVRPWEVGKPDPCSHWRCTYVVDDKKSTVECGQCGAGLNPMWVLGQLCSREAQFHESARRYQNEMARLADRSRTKCEWCGKLTRISHRSSR